MTEQDFRHGYPGWLCQIPDFLGAVVAYNPDSLPPDWGFPESLWPKLHEAGNQLMLLEGLGRSLPNAGILLKPLRNREAILSSRMEGTFATARELLLFELDPKDAADDDDQRNQHREVANYAGALEMAVQSPLPLSLMLIKQLHEVLLNGVRGENKEPGKLRNRQVGIGSAGRLPRFVPPPPDRLHDYLGPLDTYLQKGSWKYDPLVECFVVHYQFETIHPFADGNGRVGRLLLALMIQRLSAMTHPWLHMSEFFEQDHQRYCDLMHRVSTHGAWLDWIAYCLDGITWLAPRIADRCDRLLRLRADYANRINASGGSVRLSQTVDHLFVEPIVTIADLAKMLNVTYPTAKADIEKLATSGVLAEMSDLYPKTYYAAEIFDVAYEGLS